ncbi:hypothetical protein C8Q77DRAFT_810369 [Trametes polyzona]|nr:hypothetical protein C8Q77DRAFT_810369 [Trametes polyzona]
MATNFDTAVPSRPSTYAGFQPLPSKNIVPIPIAKIGGRSCVSSEAVPIVAATTYHTEQDAQAFFEYACAHVPQHIKQWDASRTESTVSVTFAIEDAASEAVSIHSAMKAYLEVLYSFPGPRYKSLTSTVYQPPRACGVTVGAAVVCFSTVDEATIFADRVVGHRYTNVRIEATTHGPAVTVKFCCSGAGEARERASLAYDAAVAMCRYDTQGFAQPVYIGPITWE